MLYKVTKTIEAYVQAVTQEDALEADLDEYGCDVFVTATLVKGKSGISEEWLASLPFRGPLSPWPDLTVGQLIESGINT